MASNWQRLDSAPYQHIGNEKISHTVGNSALSNLYQYRHLRNSLYIFSIPKKNNVVGTLQGIVD